VLYGVILLWFILTALSVAFVAIDIRTTPEATVMKWGFVRVTLFTGPFGAFLYVLGCREPLPGMHEAYVAARWRQALGSAMHCVAGDGVGILTGAVIAALLLLSPFADFLLEYVLGLLFGWGIFQALFMRAVIGGSYALSLRSTFIPELTSMNCLMAGVQHVGDISKIRPIIGDIVENHQRHVKRDGGNRDNFGKANGKHFGSNPGTQQFYNMVEFESCSDFPSRHVAKKPIGVTDFDTKRIHRY
jgi:Domain of unknown function (DUF4396)